MFLIVVEYSMIRTTNAVAFWFTDVLKGSEIWYD